MYRITVGIDAEAASSTAVDWLLGWPQARQARITLVTAYDLLLDEPAGDSARLEEERARIAAALPDAEVEVALAEGSIPGILGRRAAQSDVLVLGSHRSRRLRSVLTGAIAQRMTARADCPVIVVPDDVRPGSAGIAVGLADDDSSEGALRFAAALAAEADEVLHIIHAWSPPAVGAEFAAPLLDDADVRAAHEELLADAAAGIRDEFDEVQVVEHLHRGDAEYALRHVAGGPALIVVGTHRRGIVAGFLLGSVVSRLMRSSRTPVCVVPPVRHAVSVDAAVANGARA